MAKVILAKTGLAVDYLRGVIQPMDGLSAEDIVDGLRAALDVGDPTVCVVVVLDDNEQTIAGGIAMEEITEGRIKFIWDPSGVYTEVIVNVMLNWKDNRGLSGLTVEVGLGTDELLGYINLGFRPEKVVLETGKVRDRDGEETG